MLICFEFGCVLINFFHFKQNFCVHFSLIVVVSIQSLWKINSTLLIIRPIVKETGCIQQWRIHLCVAAAQILSILY